MDQLLCMVFAQSLRETVTCLRAINDVLSLPTGDRIQLFDRLRESLLNDPKLDLLTDEQKRLLDGRLADLEANPHDQLDWEDVYARSEDLVRARR